MSPTSCSAPRTRRFARCIAVAVLAVATTAPVLAEESREIADGALVSIEYTLTAKGEGVVDSNVGKQPLKYVQGEKQIVPGLEKALAGLSAGDTKRVEIEAKEAFGEYDESRRVEIDKGQLPADAKAGQILVTGEGVPVKVLEVGDEKAVLDVNHPLAGKDLAFDVKVLAVEDAPAAPAPKDATP